MRAQWITKGKYIGKIGIDNTFTIEGHRLSKAITVSGVTYLSTLVLSKPEARAFITACDGILTYMRSNKQGGGGRVPYEYNDELHQFYADREGSYRVTMSDNAIIYIPAGVFNDAMIRRIKKLVGEAVRLNVKKANKQLDQRLYWFMRWGK